ncbi:hypothetical protein CLOP_g16068, partial [Closterium sp. NIES-67]
MRWPPMRPDPHFADVRGWLGPLLGPVAERSGAAGAWVHRECAVWSPEVFFCAANQLKNVPAAVRRVRLQRLKHPFLPTPLPLGVLLRRQPAEERACSRAAGAAAQVQPVRTQWANIGCREERCPHTYHLPCARYDDCFFDHNDFLISCPLHTRSLMLRRHGSHLPEFNAFFGQPAGRLSGQMAKERRRRVRDLARVQPVRLGGAVTWRAGAGAAARSLATAAGAGSDPVAGSGRGSRVEPGGGWGEAGAGAGAGAVGEEGNSSRLTSVFHTDRDYAERDNVNSEARPDALADNTNDPVPRHGAPSGSADVAGSGWGVSEGVSEESGWAADGSDGCDGEGEMAAKRDRVAADSEIPEGERTEKPAATARGDSRVRAAADLEIVPGGEGEQSGVTAGGNSWDARARATGAAAEGAAATAAAAGSAGRVRDAVESGTQTASPDALDPANATETAKAPLSTPAAPAPAEAKAAAAPAEAVAEAAEAAAAAAAAEGAPAEAHPPPVPPTSAFPPWSAIGGLRPVILSLTELVLLPLRYPALFPSLGIAPPRGVLLHGLPGTGKTLVVRALAGACARGEREVAFFARHGADCLGKYVGDAEKHLRLLFEVAKQRQPSIIFFDELDGLAPARGPNQDPTHSSVVATLLALLDGLDSRGAVTVIAATNRIDAIDPALRRPGRFDREIFFPLPGVKDRKAILKAITRGWGAGVAPSGKVLEELAGRSEGFAGADLRAVCNDALMAALRKNFPMETALALDALPGAEAFGSGQPQMPAAGTPSCPRGTNSLVQAKMYRLPIPEIQVDAQDWLAALQRAQVPCALRTAAASFGKLGLATVPRYLLPILAPALVRLVRSLAETAGVGDVMRDGMNGWDGWKVVGRGGESSEGDRIGDEEEDSEEGSEEGSEEEGEEEGEEEDEMRESEEGTSEEGEEEEGEEQDGGGRGSGGGGGVSGEWAVFEQLSAMLDSQLASSASLLLPSSCVGAACIHVVGNVDGQEQGGEGQEQGEGEGDKEGGEEGGVAGERHVRDVSGSGRIVLSLHSLPSCCLQQSLRVDGLGCTGGRRGKRNDGEEEDGKESGMEMGGPVQCVREGGVEGEGAGEEEKEEGEEVQCGEEAWQEKGDVAGKSGDELSLAGRWRPAAAAGAAGEAAAGAAAGSSTREPSAAAAAGSTNCVADRAGAAAAGRAGL